MKFRVVERDMHGNVIRVMATDKTAKEAQAFADMAVVRRGVEASYFAVEEQP